jgi:hypothetical protein
MFFTSRRSALLYLCLAGMEVAWITPFWLIIYAPAPPPWSAYLSLLVGLLAWTLVLELLSRAGIPSPAYELIALALMALTSLLAVRIVIYGAIPLGDLGWLRRMLDDIFHFSGGIPPALGLIAVNLVLWQRATAATSRDPSFFNVGVNFRLGLLLLIAGAALLDFLRGQSVIGFLWLHLALGLIAVSIARVSEKANEAQSVGIVFPIPRLTQLLLATGVTVGAAWLVAAVYTPEDIRRFLHVFDPVWRLAQPLAFAVLMMLGWLLNPLLLWLDARLAGLLRDPALRLPGEILAAPGTPKPGFLDLLPPWLPHLLADVLVVVGLILAGLALIGFLLLYLERVRKGGLHAETEEEGSERVTLGGGIVARGLHALRNAAGLIQRFGLGGRLLTAFSVQNIYASVCRLARERGYPRRPSQPPDDYLPALERAFGGFSDQLGRITAAYMRVHYGDHPVTFAELAQLREDYRTVRGGEAVNQ